MTSILSQYPYRRPGGVQMGFFFLTLGLISCSGAAEPVKRNRWYEGGPGAPNLHPGRNFYKADPDRYPDVGFVLHTVDVESWSANEEKKAIRNAIELCRGEFGEAYHENLIESWDGFKTHRPQWIYPGIPAIRFKPAYVVILIRNSHDYERFKKYEDDGIPPEKIPVEELLYPYKVGYLFEAEKLFADSLKNFDEWIASGFRDEKPLSLDLSADAPAHEKVYDIVTRYQEAGQRKP